MSEIHVINGVLTPESIEAERRKVGAPGVRVRVTSKGDFEETELVAILADGTEHVIYPVSAIDIQIRIGEPNIARVTFYDVELDIVARPEV